MYANTTRGATQSPLLTSDFEDASIFFTSLEREKKSSWLTEQLLDAGLLSSSKTSNWASENTDFNPQLLPTESARAAWKKSLCKEAVICGDQLAQTLADRLSIPFVEFITRPGTERTESSSQKKLKTIFQNGAPKQNSRRRVETSSKFLKALGVAVRQSRFLIYAADESSYDDIQFLARWANKKNIFLVLVNALPFGGIRVGPMIAPGFRRSFEAALFSRVSLPESFGEHIPKEFLRAFSLGCRSESTKTDRSTIDILLKYLTTPTLPLLWGEVEIRSGASRYFKTTSHELLSDASQSPQLSLENILNKKNVAPWHSARFRRKIQQLLNEEALIRIENVFDGDFACLVQSSLLRSNRWAASTMNRPFANYSHHNLYDVDQYPIELLTVSLFFNSRPTRALIQKMTGVACKGTASTSASYYKDGEYTSPHTDNAFQRSVGYIWSLTSGWQDSWGGGFFWVPARELIMPSFNALHLFKVTPQSFHFVPPVVSGGRGQRVSVNGWWTRSDRNRDSKLKVRATQKRWLEKSKSFASFKSL